MDNEFIKSTMSRNRFIFLNSKLYVNDPDKPVQAKKTYYVDPMIECLKWTFQKYRQDSCRQTNDESMTRFKGRSSLKQYMPTKPVRRGIKMWVRCDSNTHILMI